MVNTALNSGFVSVSITVSLLKIYFSFSETWFSSLLILAYYFPNAFAFSFRSVFWFPFSLFNTVAVMFESSETWHFSYCSPLCRLIASFIDGSTIGLPVFLFCLFNCESAFLLRFFIRCVVCWLFFAALPFLRFISPVNCVFFMSCSTTALRFSSPFALFLVCCFLRLQLLFFIGLSSIHRRCWM